MSHRAELEADAFAATRTSPGAMARALRRLVQTRKVTPDRDSWTHPSIRRRLKALRAAFPRAARRSAALP
jgi:Zn-dependent protease with chaperone function